jgi:hypothetical protein
MSDILAYMKETTVAIGSREFLRNYRRFKPIAARGGKVSITEREGCQFVFMKFKERQHPPRQAPKGLDPRAFTSLDLDEPAVPPRAWTATR